MGRVSCGQAFEDKAASHWPMRRASVIGETLLLARLTSIDPGLHMPQQLRLSVVSAAVFRPRQAKGQISHGSM